MFPEQTKNFKFKTFSSEQIIKSDNQPSPVTFNQTFY